MSSIFKIFKRILTFILFIQMVYVIIFFSKKKLTLINIPNMSFNLELENQSKYDPDTLNSIQNKKIDISKKIRFLKKIQVDSSNLKKDLFDHDQSNKLRIKDFNIKNNTYEDSDDIIITFQDPHLENKVSEQDKIYTKISSDEIFTDNEGKITIDLKTTKLNEIYTTPKKIVVEKTLILNNDQENIENSSPLYSSHSTSKSSIDPIIDSEFMNKKQSNTNLELKVNESHDLQEKQKIISSKELRINEAYISRNKNDHLHTRSTTTNSYSAASSLRIPSSIKYIANSDTRLNTPTVNRPRKVPELTSPKTSSNSKGNAVVNPHDFKYLINPDQLCNQTEEIYVILFVHTHPLFDNRRMIVRETWGNPNTFHDRIRRIFVMGKIGEENPMAKAIQSTLEFEASLYGDIVQEDFVDTYHNLSLKAVAGLKWISKFCANAKYVVKVDDDIFVNMFSLLRKLEKDERRDDPGDLLECLTWQWMPVLRTGKWAVEERLYKDKYYPVYCSGSAVVYSQSMANKLHNASYNVAFFWVDDVYAYGLLPKYLKMTVDNFKRINHLYDISGNKIDEDLKRRKVDGHLFYHSPGRHSQFRNLWKKFVDLNTRTANVDLNIRTTNVSLTVNAGGE